MTMLRLVSATRLSEAEFWCSSFLGRSLRAMPSELRPELALRFDNVGERCMGLAAYYNRALDSCPESRQLLFVHDDVYLHDPFLALRVLEALRKSDVVGLAGSRNSDLSQPSWCLAFDSELNGLGWQSSENLVLSGAVSHCPSLPLAGGPPPLQTHITYGPLETRCDLLDGVFLAVRPERLSARGGYGLVRFDERFDFHLYDLDFCRTCSSRGLALRTMAYAVTHASGGAFCTPGWKHAARAYLGKWPPPELRPAERSRASAIAPLKGHVFS